MRALRPAEKRVLETAHQPNIAREMRGKIGQDVVISLKESLA